MRRLVLLMVIGACGDDGGVSPDAAPPADAAPDAQHLKFARVGVIEDKAMNVTLAAAIFGTDIDVVLSTRDDGICRVEQAVKGPGLPVSAGAVTISGGTAATVTMMFDPAGGGGGYFAMSAGLSYTGGDQLMIAATGATAPGFSGAITFPATVSVTSGSPTVVRKSGFTATWSATTSPVVITITQYPSGGPRLVVNCAFDGAAGTGTVPSSALTELLTTVTAGVGISTQTSMKMMVGEYPAELLAIYGALGRQNVPVQQ